MSDNVARVRNIVERHLNEIATYFDDNIKLTFIARLPGNDEADIMLTIDDPNEIIKFVERRCIIKSAETGRGM